MSGSRADIDLAIDALTNLPRAHAAAALDGAPPATTVPLAHEAAVAAEQYGSVLGEATGWSNPLGHLRRTAPAPTVNHGPPVHVRIDYEFDLPDAARLVQEVQNRFGDDGIATVADAIRATVAADGWEPTSYLGPLVGRPISTVRIDPPADDPNRGALAASASRALLDLPTPALRAVWALDRDHRLSFQFVYDHPVTDVERELSSLFGTYLVADYPDGYSLEEPGPVHVPMPAEVQVPEDAVRVYQRYEPGAWGDAF